MHTNLTRKSPPSARRKTWLIVAGAVVGLGIVAAIAVPVRSAILTDQACRLVTSYVTENGPVQTVGDGPTRISILGDSYTAGDVLDDRADRWVTRFAELEDATVSFDAIGSTGFTNSGACNGNTFADRIHSMDDAAADVFILQGGLNDVGAEGVGAAASALLDSAPDARIIIVGPVDSDARNGEADVDAALRQVAEKHDVEYVSAMGWPVEFADGLHMTPQGHSDYADRVAAAISGG